MPFHYNFSGLYKKIRPLMKHTVDVYRAETVTDQDGISSESWKRIFSGVEAYIRQDIRAPYMAINNDDTLKVSSFYNVHVKHDIMIRTGDWVEGFGIGGVRVAHGFCGEVRYGTLLNRALINKDDTKSQNPPFPSFVELGQDSQQDSQQEQDS